MQESRSKRRLIGQFYLVRMRVNGEGDEQKLEIVLQNSKTSHIYDIQVTADFIKADNVLSLSFDNLQSLGRYLIKSFVELKTTQEGNLVFQVKIGIKTHSIVLQAHKRDSTPLQLLNRHTQNIVLEAKQQLSTKTADIQVALNKTATNQNYKIKALQQKLEKQNKKIKALIVAVVILVLLWLLAGERIYRLYSFQQKAPRIIESSTPEEKVKQPINRKQEEKAGYSKQAADEIQKKTSHSDAFTIKHHGHRTMIQYSKDDNIWRTFVRGQVISKYAITRYQVKLVQTQFNHVLVGVATSEVFGKENGYASKESIIYDSNDGEIWNSSKRKKVGRAVRQGQNIKMSVNTIGQEVKWTVGNETLAVTTIPQHMRQKDLYFVIMMKYNTDIVELRYD